MACRCLINASLTSRLELASHNFSYKMNTNYEKVTQSSENITARRGKTIAKKKMKTSRREKAREGGKQMELEEKAEMKHE
ncbi:hypothetical protein E2C01_089525 [Portunus trituberculatus]|uniref:Uncharacterized protein n=1 Tax=Portunus trituberculatus TaxID=210409 RepID=A0A5B7JHG7_PORTR|nr:hypothetical protein [Portunus trituberculatus]